MTAFQRAGTLLASVSYSSWATAVASVPLMIWANDSLFSLHIVRGTSMEPSLRSGDVVVVRKADGLWQRYTRAEEDPTRIVQRREQVELERIHCHSSGPSRILQRPPLPVLGDIILYKDPAEYPWKYTVKRVVGLGQQVVMMPADRYRTPSTSNYQMPSKEPDPTPIMRVASPCVPPYSLWVEGDNPANRTGASPSHGPVTKKLLVGIVEYRIWPPTRIGKLGEETDGRSDPKPYSYWP